MSEQHKYCNLLNLLQSALKYTKVSCILGSSNKSDSVVKTRGWSFFSDMRRRPGHYQRLDQNKPNSEDLTVNATVDFTTKKLKASIKKWYYHLCGIGAKLLVTKDNCPVLDPKFNLTSAQLTLLDDACDAEELRFANCHGLSAVTAKRLWEYSLKHPEIERIEFVKSTAFSHYYLIINRSGSSKDSSTWGDAWLIDPWYKEGIIYPAKEFNHQIAIIKTYAEDQIKQLKELGVTAPEHVSPTGDAVNFEVVCEIVPKAHKYPSHSYNPLFELNYYIEGLDYNGDVSYEEVNQVSDLLNGTDEKSKRLQSFASGMGALFFIRDNKEKFDLCLKELTQKKIS